MIELVIKFFMSKDYDQLRGITINESIFQFRIVDFEFKENQKLNFLVKRQDEAEKDRRCITLTREKDTNLFTVFMPFDTKGAYDFRLTVIETINGKEYKREGTAVNKFIYDNVEYSEEELKKNTEYDLVAGMLKDLDDLHDSTNAIDDYIANADLDVDIYKYTDTRVNTKFNEMLDNFLNEFSIIFDDFIEEGMEDVEVTEEEL